MAAAAGDFLAGFFSAGAGDFSVGVPSDFAGDLSFVFLSTDPSLDRDLDFDAGGT